MKKFLAILFSFLFLNCSAFAVEGFDIPLPEESDDVTTSGPDTKFSTATQMRFDAFQNIEVNSLYFVPEERRFVQIYKLSDNEKYLQKVKIPNAKIIEYTNGSFDIKFKDTPDMIFSYDKDGNLQEFSEITNKAKVPFTTYHYDAEGQINAVEIKPDRYNSYTYDMNGLLMKYTSYDKVYAPNGKLILRRKSSFF